MEQNTCSEYRTCSTSARSAAVVPVHSGEMIGPGLLLKILKDVELAREDLESVETRAVCHSRLPLIEPIRRLPS